MGKTVISAINVLQRIQDSKDEKILVLVPTKEVALNIYKKYRLMDSQNKITISRLGSLTWVAPIVELLSDSIAK